MATVLNYHRRERLSSPRSPKEAARAEAFAAVMQRLTSRIDWSEATAEDEYDAALAAFDIVCGRPSARRTMTAA